MYDGHCTGRFCFITKKRLCEKIRNFFFVNSTDNFTLHCIERDHSWAGGGGGGGGGGNVPPKNKVAKLIVNLLPAKKHSNVIGSIIMTYLQLLATLIISTRVDFSGFSALFHTNDIVLHLDALAAKPTTKRLSRDNLSRMRDLGL